MWNWLSPFPWAAPVTNKLPTTDVGRLVRLAAVFAVWYAVALAAYWLLGASLTGPVGPSALLSVAFNMTLYGAFLFGRSLAR